MARLWFGVVVAAVAFTVFSLVDACLCDRSRIRAVPRAAWCLIIVLFPVMGGILWFLIGRGRARTAVTRVIAPDDDPDFLDRIGKRYDQQKREQNQRTDARPGWDGNGESAKPADV